MKLTARGRCALRAMVELALHEDKRLPVKEIAKRQALSVRYLEQVIASLKKSKLVNGTKGPNGGYTLDRPSELISVADIIFSVEGRNLFYKATQEDVLGQTLGDLWQTLDQNTETYLSGISLNQIMMQFKEKSANHYMYFI